MLNIWLTLRYSRGKQQNQTIKVYEFHAATLWLTWLLSKEVADEAPEHCLVADDEHVAGSFQLHDDRCHTCHDVLVRLAPRVAVAQLVLIAPGKFRWILLLHLLVSQSLANTLKINHFLNKNIRMICNSLNRRVNICDQAFWDFSNFLKICIIDHESEIDFDASAGQYFTEVCR